MLCCAVLRRFFSCFFSELFQDAIVGNGFADHGKQPPASAYLKANYIIRNSFFGVPTPESIYPFFFNLRRFGAFPLPGVVGTTLFCFPQGLNACTHRLLHQSYRDHLARGFSSIFLLHWSLGSFFYSFPVPFLSSNPARLPPSFPIASLKSRLTSSLIQHLHKSKRRMYDSDTV